MIGRLLASIIVNAIVLFVLIRYFPERGLSISPTGAITLQNMLILGVIFGVLNGIVREIVDFILLPLKVLTFGLLALPLYLIVTLGLFYVFAYVVQYFGLGFSLVLGGPLQLLILSLVISVFTYILKKIL